MGYGKRYTHQKTSLIIIDGIVESIAEDRMSCVVNNQIYDAGSKTMIEEHNTVKYAYPLPEDIEVGKNVAAVGYPAGGAAPAMIIMAQAISAKGLDFENEQIAIVAGHIMFARLNNEKNPDGTARTKADGLTPKKPHYDIGISVPGAEGKNVLHVIQVYDITNGKTDSKPQIETARRRIEGLYAFLKPGEEPKKNESGLPPYGFKDNASTPTYVTIVTQPHGEIYEKEKQDAEGNTFTNYTAYHLGIKSLDVIPEYEHEAYQKKDKNQAQAKAAPAAPAAAPAQKAAPAPAPAPAIDPAQAIGGQNAPIVQEEFEEPDGIDFGGPDEGMPF